MQKDGSLLLSHPVGSGKTLTSIAAFEALRAAGKATNALVVTPASLRNNYLENGVNKFTDARGAVFGNAQEIADGTGVSFMSPVKGARYHVVSYDMFRKEPAKYIKAANADTLIFDELHKAKNETAKTTEAIKSSRGLYRNFIGMTGSIVSNTPGDIVPLVDAMTNGKHSLGNKSGFENRFVSVTSSGDRTLRNPQVLRSLVSPYVHHVDHSDLIHVKVPKKVVENVDVEMSPEQTELYRFYIKKLDPISAIKMQLGASKLKPTDMNNIFSKIITLRQLANSVHTVDRDITPEESAIRTPKIKKILDDVEQHLNETSDGQAVIHTNLIHGGVDVLTAGLKARGIDHALFIGKGQPGVTEESRQSGVSDYQAGKKRVIVLSAAGGEGLDLPNTTFMAMTDGHFNPERIGQAEARGIRAGGQAHRPEEKRHVIVRRYRSVLPSKTVGRAAEIGSNIVANVSPAAILQRLQSGGPILFNPFTKAETADQWVYRVATGKHGLNTAVRGSLKTAAISVNPTVAGALLGGGYGALLGAAGKPTKADLEQDPNVRTRNIITGGLAGAAGGAMLGKNLKDAFDDPFSQGLSVGAIYSSALAPLAGIGLGSIMLKPKREMPKKLTDVMGKQQEYSDKALFQKYWDEFGHTLEKEGPDAPLPTAREGQYIDALRELYTVGKKSPSVLLPGEKEKPSKGRLLATGLIGAGISALPMAPDIQRGSTVGKAALNILPFASLIPIAIAQRYRDLYVDPYTKVVKQQARVRSGFTDEQLQKLLRGGAVDEVKVKKHAI
jgi:superfamily II DNA or RNA helicase